MRRSLFIVLLAISAGCAPQVATLGLRPVDVARSDARSATPPALAAEIAWIEGNDRTYARQVLNAAIAETPNDAALRLRRALLAEVALDHATVLTDLTEIIGAAPASPEAGAALTLTLERFSAFAAQRASIASAIDRSGLLDATPAPDAHVAMASLLRARIHGLDRDPDAAVKATERGGWIAAMQVVGPLAPQRYSALTTATSAERDGVGPATYRGLSLTPREVIGWRGGLRLGSADRRGLYVGEAWLRVDAARAIVVRTFASSSMRVSIDGAPVLERIDDRLVQASLCSSRRTVAAGWHRLTVATLAPGSVRVSVLGADGAPVIAEQRATPPGVSSAGLVAEVATEPGTCGDRTSVTTPFERWLAAELALTSWGRDVERARAVLRPLTATASTSAALATTEARLMSIEGLGASQVSAQTRRALALDANAPRVLMMMAASMRRDTPDRALELADLAAKEAPSAAEPDSLRFAVMQRRGWNAEAKASLESALAKRPTLSLLSKAERFYRSQWRTDRADALAAEAKKLQEYPAHALLKAALRRADLAAAIDAARSAVPTDPARWLERVAQLELARGDPAAALAAADEALAADPLRSRAWQRRAVASALAGDVATATAAIAHLSTLDLPDVELAVFDATLRGTTPGAPRAGSKLEEVLAVDSVALAGAAVDPSWSKNAMVRLLDRHVDFVGADGHSLAITHLVERLQTKDATDSAGEYRLGAQDLALALRTIKADGTVVDVDRHPGKPDLSFSALAPGDAVEKKILSVEPPATPEGGFSRRFYFQDDTPNLVSELILVVDAGTDVRWTGYHGAPEPVVHKEDGRELWVFRADAMAGVPPEPHSVPHEEFLPFVVVTIGLDDARAAAANIAPFGGYARGSWDIQDKAEALVAGKATDHERAEAIFRWVVDEIGHSGPSDPTVTLHTKRGDRTALTLALLRAAGLDASLVLARSGSQPKLTPAYPDPRRYLAGVIRVQRREDPNGVPIWIRPDLRTPWFGLVTEDLSGGSYLPVDGGPAARFRKDEVAAWVLESEVSATVDASGTATGWVEMRLPGLPGASIRNAVGTMRAAALDRAFQGWVASFIPGAELKKVTLTGRDDALGPMTVRVDFAAPGFMADAGGRRVIHRFFDTPMASGAVGVRPLESYLRVGRRTSPMYLWPSAERTKVTVKFEGLTATPTEKPASFERRTKWGYFTQEFRWDAATNTARFSRAHATKATRIAVTEFDDFRNIAQELILRSRGRLVFEDK